MFNWFDLTMLGGSRLAAVLVTEAAKSAVVLTVAGAANLMLRRRPAALRHWVWMLALAGTLAVPALSAVLPSWRLGLPSPRGEDPGGTLLSATTQAFVSPPVAGTRGDETAGRAASAKVAIPLAPGSVPGAAPLASHETEGPLTRSGRFAARSAAAALATWAVGMLACVVPVALGLLRLRRLARVAKPVADAQTLGLVDKLAATVGLTRPVRLVRSAEREIPMTWGVYRPVILLPEDSERWSPERVSVALLHELAHVKRRDCSAQLIARIACAFHWFNPLAWFALKRVRVEQEQASDDLALRAGVDPVEYADHLLAIVTGRPAGGMYAGLASAMASSRRLELRLVGILDPARDRRAVGRGRAGLAAIVAAGVVAGLAALSFQTAAEAGADEPPKGPSEVLKQVRDMYIKPLEESTLRAGAIKGMIEVLHDPYSEFYDAQRLAIIEREFQNKLTGIGAQLRIDEGKISVFTPLPDSPALKAGVRPGDVIESVDGKSTQGVDLATVVRWIVGPAGSVVRLSLRHPDGRSEELSITRGTITMRTVNAFWRGGARPDFLLDPDHAIGYVAVDQLGEGTANELKTVIERLKEQGIKGLILDLRSCPGGLMAEAIAIAKLFLSKGTIVTIRGRDDAPTHHKVDDPALLSDLPLVVLIDEHTASAAEIVSGALKDNNRAILVGSRTIGKGSVQTIIKLDDGSAIKLTTAYYELPSGRNIDKRDDALTWGVDPTDGDFVPLNSAQEEALRRKRSERERIGGPTDPKARGAKVTPEWIRHDQADPQLGAALETLIARITTGDFVRVGLPSSEISARAKRLEDARKRKESLREELRKVDEELTDLGVAEPAAKK
jgi:carboxyl-terminal processing protease